VNVILGATVLLTEFLSFQWKELADKPDPDEHPRYDFFVRCHYDLSMLQMVTKIDLFLLFFFF